MQPEHHCLNITIVSAVNIAQDFSEKSGITVVHETHRGRVGNSPQIIEQIFRVNKNFMITTPFTNLPVANQFEINCYMKDLLNQRYSQYR